MWHPGEAAFLAFQEDPGAAFPALPFSFPTLVVPLACLSSDTYLLSSVILLDDQVIVPEAVLPVASPVCKCTCNRANHAHERRALLDEFSERESVLCPPSIQALSERGGGGSGRSDDEKEEETVSDLGTGMLRGRPMAAWFAACRTLLTRGAILIVITP